MYRAWRSSLIVVFIGLDYASVLMLLVPSGAYADQAIEILTDQEFATRLKMNVGASIPIFLGCNRSADVNPRFPVRCFFDRTDVVVSEATNETVKILPLIESFGDTDGWQDVADTSFERSIIANFSWPTDVQSVWVDVGEYQVIACAYSPREQKIAIGSLSYKSAATCYLAFDRERSENSERVIQVRFGDLGILTVLGPNGPSNRKDSYYFENFVTFFCLRTYAISDWE